MTTTTITLQVTIHGETRPVDFDVVSYAQYGERSRAFAKVAVLGRFPTGDKLHPMILMAWEQADGSWAISYRDRIRNGKNMITAVAWDDAKWDAHRAAWYPGGVSGK